jgi:hypothetical protein
VQPAAIQTFTVQLLDLPRCPTGALFHHNTLCSVVVEDARTKVSCCSCQCNSLAVGPCRKGDRVSVHYTGTLTNGQKFDSSRDRRAQQNPLGIPVVTIPCHGSVTYTTPVLSCLAFPDVMCRGRPFVFTLGQGEVIKGW